MRKKKQPPLDARVERDKIRFARFTRSVIRMIATLLGGAFLYLQVKDIQAANFLTPNAADVIWRSAMVIYFWAWVGGVTFDANIQELAYDNFPGQGKWPIQALGVVCLFVAIAYVLLQAFGNIIEFSLALTLFFVVDHGSWVYMKYFLGNPIRQSRARYLREGRFAELEILNTVDELIFGKWKIWRMTAGGIIILLADLFAFSESVERILAQATRLFCPWLSLSDAATLLYATLVISFVGVMEIWHWLMRVRTHLRVETLEYIQGRYKIGPK